MQFAPSQHFSPEPYAASVGRSATKKYGGERARAVDTDNAPLTLFRFCLDGFFYFPMAALAALEALLPGNVC